MLLLKIIVVGALVIGVMVAVKDGRIMRDAGLLSTCSAGHRQRPGRSDLAELHEGPPRRLAGRDEQLVQPDRRPPRPRILALPGAGRLVADADRMNARKQRPSGGIGPKAGP